MDQSVKIGVCFFLTVISYFVGKVFALPPFYPVIPFSFSLIIEEKEWVLKSFAKLALVLFSILVFGIFVTKDGIDSWSSYFGVCISGFIFLIFFGIGRKRDNLKYLDPTLIFFSFLFSAFFIFSAVRNFETLFNLISNEGLISMFLRTALKARFELINYFDPFGHLDMMKVNLSFAGLVGTWMALRGNSNEVKGKTFYIGLSLLFICLVLSTSRGPVLAITFLLVAKYLKHVALKRTLIAFLLMIPLLLPMLPDKFLNGRQYIYKNTIPQLSLVGNGIGSSVRHVKQVRRGKNSHLHSIHLEIAYDFGLLFYSFLFLISAYYLLKHAALVTAFMIFFILAVSYTIYSPWTWLTLSLSLTADIYLKRNLRSYEL